MARRVLHFSAFICMCDLARKQSIVGSNRIQGSQFFFEKGKMTAACELCCVVSSFCCVVCELFANACKFQWSDSESSTKIIHTSLFAYVAHVLSASYYTNHQDISLFSAKSLCTQWLCASY